MAAPIQPIGLLHIIISLDVNALNTGTEKEITENVRETIQKLLCNLYSSSLSEADRTKICSLSTKVLTRLESRSANLDKMSMVFLRNCSDEVISNFLGLDNWLDNEPFSGIEHQITIEKYKSHIKQSVIKCVKNKEPILNFGGYSLSSLFSEIKMFTFLTTLWCGKNKLTFLPLEIGNLKKLTVLELNHNNPSSFPSEIGNLKELQTLKLDNNQLSSLPSEIGDLKKLEVLALNDNDLRSLPPEIGNLKGLKKLRLDNNQLSSLPKEIKRLTNLKDLELSNNMLTELPEEIAELAALTYLGAANNQLTALPFRITALKLQLLSLQNNKITSFPRIGLLGDLTSLNLSNNAISELDEIESLKKLIYLNLSMNQLTNLPAIGSLDTLGRLNLSHNQFKSLLPFGKFKNLTSLDLSNNKLEDIPEGLDFFCWQKNVTKGRCVEVNLQQNSLTPDSKIHQALSEYLSETNKLVDERTQKALQSHLVIDIGNQELDRITDKPNYVSVCYQLRVKGLKSWKDFEKLFPQTAEKAKLLESQLTPTESNPINSVSGVGIKPQSAQPPETIIKINCVLPSEHVGQNLYIRGNGAGLNWDKGIRLEKIGEHTYQFKTTTEFGKGVEYKVLIKDEIWEGGDNSGIKQGENVERNASF